MWTLVLLALAALLWLLRMTFGEGLGLTDPSAGHIVTLGALALSMLAAAQLAHALLIRVLLHASRNRGLVTSDLVRSTLAVALYMATVVAYLRFVLALDVTSVLATSALLSAIIGLALQPMLGHLFAGVSIELERPVRIGDFVRRDEMEGRVISLSWRSVHIQTDRGSVFVMPNSDFTAKLIEVVPQNQPFRHQVFFHVGSDQPPGQVIRVAMQVFRSGLPNILQLPSPSVIALGNDPVGGTIRYSARFSTLQVQDRGTIGSHFLERLWYALSRAGIELPAQPAIWTAAGQANGQMDGEAPVVPLLRSRAELEPKRFPGELASLSPALGEMLLLSARSVRYGKNERCDGAALSLILEGQLRERHQGGIEQFDDILDRLITAVEEQGGASLFDVGQRRLSEAEFHPLLDRATLVIGPLARSLCASVAALTSDAFLAYRAVAASIPTEEAREAFLAEAPQAPVRPLQPGDWYGWPYAMGRDTAPPLCEASRDCRLLAWTPGDFAAALAGAGEADLEILVRHLSRHAAGCEALTVAELRTWALRAA
ncbi:hypothetical protein GCM10011611_41310 [Aliidongia dinghuensis]|uniref:Small-conductance mechanosensitive channel n=1 Tax=Aliidongia dinghuensis TaxID=1867774 RepID=A0A8J2YXW0_9PROT|nr:mechanosensitive ion channel family protein [Aliidongia dinghuensis]GGF30952.1 hypothetical protein GCM10011611_41310 [Aliidongia dinghuensis]